MDNNEFDVRQFVEGRMASLDASTCGWQPDAMRALTRLKMMQQGDHLDHLLPLNVEPPWFVSLWTNFKEMIHPPQLPPLEVTSKPIPVKDIWGLYATNRKSMLYSVALQSAVVAAAFAVSLNPTVQQAVRQTVTPLVAPVLKPLDMAPKKNTLQGGGGGGDRSAIPAAKGRLPKIAMKQFVPPTEVVVNQNPKLTMEPTIVAPPDAILPNANLPNIGDPLAKLGPASNGMGSGGGIGSGVGAGFGPGSGGGFGGGAFRVGGGVTQPAVVYKVDPEYSEEARKAKYSGTVMLSLVVDVDGKAKAIRVVKGVGLGLDERAIEAVQKWKFTPGKKNGQAVPVYATVEVNFRLL